MSVSPTTLFSTGPEPIPFPSTNRCSFVLEDCYRGLLKGPETCREERIPQLDGSHDSRSPSHSPPPQVDGPKDKPKSAKKNPQKNQYSCEAKYPSGMSCTSGTGDWECHSYCFKHRLELTSPGIEPCCAEAPCEEVRRFLTGKSSEAAEDYWHRMYLFVRDKAQRAIKSKDWVSYVGVSCYFNYANRDKKPLPIWPHAIPAVWSPDQLDQLRAEYYQVQDPNHTTNFTPALMFQQLCTNWSFQQTGPAQQAPPVANYQQTVINAPATGMGQVTHAAGSQQQARQTGMGQSPSAASHAAGSQQQVSQSVSHSLGGPGQTTPPNRDRRKSSTPRHITPVRIPSDHASPRPSRARKDLSKDFIDYNEPTDYDTNLPLQHHLDATAAPSKESQIFTSRAAQEATLSLARHRARYGSSHPQFYQRQGSGLIEPPTQAKDRVTTPQARSVAASPSVLRRHIADTLEDMGITPSRKRAREPSSLMIPNPESEEEDSEEIDEVISISSASKRSRLSPEPSSTSIYGAVPPDSDSDQACRLPATSSSTEGMAAEAQKVAYKEKLLLFEKLTGQKLRTPTKAKGKSLPVGAMYHSAFPEKSAPKESILLPATYGAKERFSSFPASTEAWSARHPIPATGWYQGQYPKFHLPPTDFYAPRYEEWSMHASTADNIPKKLYYTSEKLDAKLNKMPVSMANINKVEQGLFRVTAALSHLDQFGSTIMANNSDYVAKFIDELANAPDEESARIAHEKAKKALTASQELQTSMATATHDCIESTIGMGSTITMWKRDHHLSLFNRRIKDDILRELKQEPTGQQTLFSSAGLKKASEFLIQDRPQKQMEQLTNVIQKISSSTRPSSQKSSSHGKTPDHKGQGHQSSSSGRGRGKSWRGGRQKQGSQRPFQDDKGGSKSYQSSDKSKRGRGNNNNNFSKSN